MPKNEKEIEYLKHLQEHNMFNYNVNKDIIHSLSSIFLSVILVFLTLVLLIYNSSLIQNENIVFYFGILFLIFFFINLIILERYIKAKCAIKSTQKAFKNFHVKIQDRYKMMDIDIDALSK